MEWAYAHTRVSPRGCTQQLVSVWTQVVLLADAPQQGFSVQKQQTFVKLIQNIFSQKQAIFAYLSSFCCQGKDCTWTSVVLSAHASQQGFKSTITSDVFF